MNNGAISYPFVGAGRMIRTIAVIAIKECDEYVSD